MYHEDGCVDNEYCIEYHRRMGSPTSFGAGEEKTMNCT